MANGTCRERDGDRAASISPSLRGMTRQLRQSHRSNHGRMARISGLAFFLACFWSLSLTAQETPAIDSLFHFEHLARLRPFVKVGSFSSYDRTGGNDDGFSGKYSFIRKEGDALVVAELKGPG